MSTPCHVLAVLALSFTAGCGYRDAKMWQDDTGKVFASKTPDIQACYDGVLKQDPKAKGKVSIAFEVETEGGKIQGITVEKAATTAPDSLAECVTKNIGNLAVSPPDKRLGQGKWSWEFGVGLVASGAATSKSAGGGGGGADSGKKSGSVVAQYSQIRPSAQFSKTASGAVRIVVMGVIDPATSKPIDLEPKKNLFVTEDGKDVELKVIPRDPQALVPMDLVFVVDNSASMGEEADSIAAKIVEFAKLLSGSGLDARFAVIGVDGRPNGAIELGAAEAMEAHLNREKKKGTQRTVGFSGAAAAKLDAAAKAAKPTSPSGENGISGIVFAEKNLSWRPNTQRVFISFTDEPTQPDKKPEWSTKAMCERWTPSSGTIHTVWSGEPLEKKKWVEMKDENPAEMSKCSTGGIVMEVKKNANDLDLTSLPMTAALKSTIQVEMKSADASKPHNVVITVKGENSEGKTEYKEVKY